MLSRVFLFDRGMDQMVLRIIVDHRFGEDLVLITAA